MRRSRAASWNGRDPLLRRRRSPSLPLRNGRTTVHSPRLICRNRSRQHAGALPPPHQCGTRRSPIRGARGFRIGRPGAATNRPLDTPAAFVRPGEAGPRPRARDLLPRHGQAADRAVPPCPTSDDVDALGRCSTLPLSDTCRRHGPSAETTALPRTKVLPPTPAREGCVAVR
jgi:hypothetical protein